MRERILVLIEQMERGDDESVMAGNDKDDSNEEGDPIPAEWRQIGFDEYSVPNA
jgi:hypothetical protein